MAKWIEFIEAPHRAAGRKTKVWEVRPMDGGEELGAVEWYTRWRKYVFAPNSCTVYEQDCLRDIADFCEKKTREHRVSYASGSA